MKKMVLGITALLLSCNLPPKYAATPAKVQLAQCLVDKGVMMYGAEWCGYCTKEKEAFGPEAWGVFKSNYVDCEASEENYRLCIGKNIQTFPSLEFKDGTIVTGYKSLGILAKLSKCD